MEDTRKSQCGRMSRERSAPIRGGDFNRVVEELCKICDPDADVPRPPNGKWGKAGLYMGDHFSLAWRQLDAQYWGVPQRRKRIFAVLDLGGQCAGEILFEREGLSRDFTEVRRKGQAPTRPSGGSPDEHDSCYAVESHPQAGRVSLSGDNIVQTLAGRMGTGGGNVPLVVCPSAGFMRNPSGRAGGIGYEEELSPTLLAERPPAVAVPLGFQQFAYDKWRESDRGATLKAVGGSYGGGSETLILTPLRLTSTTERSREGGQ